MIWTIARREFLSNVITLRFLIGFVVCLVLIVSSMYVLIEDYAARLEAYQRSAAMYMGDVKGIRAFSRFDTRYQGVHVDRPPSNLSFLCIGSDRRMGNVTHFGYQKVPVEATGGGGSDPLSGDSLMVVFSSLDMILITQMILSLLTLLFAYDTISGERDRGTLAQVLSNPIPRHHILMGKFVGGMMSVILPLLVGLLAGLIVVWFSGDVALKAADWARIGLVIFTSLLYISVFFTTGLLISSLTGRSATSLVFLLFLWVFFVTIVPNMGPYMAKQILPIPDKSVLANQEAALRAELETKLDTYGDKLRQEGLYPEGIRDYQSGGIPMWKDPYAELIRYATKEHLRWYLAGTKYRLPLLLEYANRIWMLYQEYDRELNRQLLLAQFLSRVSPAWSYYNASAILTGTGEGCYLRFMDQARRYRQELIDYARSKGGISSLPHFTRMTMDDAPTMTEAEEMVKRLGHDAFEKKMTEYLKNVKPFDDIPTFQYEPERIAGSLTRALPDLAILAILNVILLMFAYVSFMRGRVK